MAVFDLIVRNGQIVQERGPEPADIGVADGRIVAVEPGLAGSAGVELDAAGRRVRPGAIDPHVHFNEPGRTAWEGWASGTAALVAGGVTTCLEMPLNANPPTTNRAAFDAKLAAAQASSRADFALWGGLTPDSLDHLEGLAAAGVIGFKAFMSGTGTPDFQHADDDTLFLGMQRAADLGLPVAVHAENDAITAGMARRAVAAGQVTMADYLASRPVVAEVEAIARAITLAAAAGCALHIVHVSTAAGVTLVEEARGRGVDVTCETCPHYLVFNAADAVRIGPLAKCAPPLRDPATVTALWEEVAGGQVDMLASDHSPSLPEMKESADAFANWGGISGCQHLSPIAWSLAEERGLAETRMLHLLTGGAARRFALVGKGGIAVGNDADLVIWDHTPPSPLTGVRYRHPRSAWDHTDVTWRPHTSVLRGQVVFGPHHQNGPAGRFLPGPAFQGGG
jgi:allantoinase